jgi:uncharacterized protein (DUF924 family)
MDAENVINFWFTESTPREWFEKNLEYDEKIRSRFLESYADVVVGKTAHWRTTPPGRLAEILILDQFARNMFRDQPQAFAHDDLALTLAKKAVRVGDDKKLPELQRQFIYMPYMHSESPRVHEEALLLFEALGDKRALKYELMHKKIIDTFGRYPHRNDLLGRISTPEESVYLETHSHF